jgi:hypothetical protein
VNPQQLIVSQQSNVAIGVVLAVAPAARKTAR